MQLDLGWIEDFLVLAERRSFSQAARQRAISQSAFSKRIRSLELAMGGEMIRRKVQPLTLTPLGEQFLKDAAPILAAVRRARTNAADLLGHGQNEITFAAATSLAQSFYPRWITGKTARLRQMVPLLAASRSWPEEILALHQGETDFMLVYHSEDRRTALDGPDFICLTLGSEEILPVSAPDRDGQAMFGVVERAGPADARGTPQLRGLAGASGPAASARSGPRPGRMAAEADDGAAAQPPVPYLARLSGSYIGALVEMRIAQLSLPTVRAFAGANGENIMGLLLQGTGLGWMPLDRVRHELASGRLVRAGSDDWSIHVEVRLYRRASRLRPVAERFWQLLSRNQDEFPAH